MPAPRMSAVLATHADATILGGVSDAVAALTLNGKTLLVTPVLTGAVSSFAVLPDGTADSDYDALRIQAQKLAQEAGLSYWVRVSY